MYLGQESVPVSQHDILSQNDCLAAGERVMALQPQWTVRSNSGGFFSLGAASYLDAPNRQEVYLEAAKASNPVLHESFDWLLGRVKDFFEELLGEPVYYDDRYALPGFHIFILRGDDRSGDKPSARAHFDLQWMHAIPDCKPTGTLSFTLPVEVPSGGSSMEIWPAAHYQDAARLGFNTLQYAAEHPSQRVAYTPGRIVIHDGYILHAIGTAMVARPEGYRITMQGHGVRLQRGWMLYW